MSATLSIMKPTVKNERPKTMLRLIFEAFLEHRMAVAAFAVICFFCAVAIFADVIAAALGLALDAEDILSQYSPKSAEHIFGTDDLGRDVFIRLVYGTRISLTVAFISAISAAVIGILVGSLAGYFGKAWDAVLMRVTDALLALPTLPILIILAAVDLGKVPLAGPLLADVPSGTVSIIKMIFILVAFSWMIEARLVRGAILSIKEREFVLAAKTLGMSHFGIIVREILPNVLSPVIVAVTMNIGQAILYEAALSFLGLGIQPPTPSWGNMLNNAREVIYMAPPLKWEGLTALSQYPVALWNSPATLAILPGLLILIVVVSFNFLGDGLQDALDPKAIKR